VRTLRTPAGDKLPISWTEYFLRPRFRGVVAQIGKRPGPVYPLLERRFKVSIARIEQNIGACLMPAGIARRLATRTDSAALRVIHRMVSAKDGTLYCTVSLYPADRFRYVQALKRAETQ
jgi:DNA-binding GntR family transcriptional regulator